MIWITVPNSPYLSPLPFLPPSSPTPPNSYYTSHADLPVSCVMLDHCHIATVMAIAEALDFLFLPLRYPHL